MVTNRARAPRAAGCRRPAATDVRTGRGCSSSSNSSLNSSKAADEQPASTTTGAAIHTPPPCHACMEQSFIRAHQAPLCVLGVCAIPARQRTPAACRCRLQATAACITRAGRPCVPLPCLPLPGYKNAPPTTGHPCSSPCPAAGLHGRQRYVQMPLACRGAQPRMLLLSRAAPRPACLPTAHESSPLSRPVPTCCSDASPRVPSC